MKGEFARHRRVELAGQHGESGMMFPRMTNLGLAGLFIMAILIAASSGWITHVSSPALGAPSRVQHSAPQAADYLSSAGTLVAPHAGSLPSVDGNLGEWNARGPDWLNFGTANSVAGSIPSLADLNVGLHTAWTVNALYIAATITDDKLIGNESANLWDDDSLELGIQIGGYVRQFVLGEDGRHKELIDGSTSLVPAMTYITQTVEGGWHFEASIPIAELGVGSLAAGQTFPFTYGYWDDDTGGAGDSHLIRWGTSTNSQPGEWGQLSLSSADYPFQAAVVNAPHANTRPAIDGDLADWAGIGAVYLDWSRASFIGGSETAPTPDDLSNWLRAAWASDTLYFAATLRDDALIGQDSTDIWGDDIIELALHIAAGNDHQFSLCVDGRQADRGILISSLTVATRMVPGGWNVEAAVPIAVLGSGNLTADQQYPHTFALWDDDLDHGGYGQTHMLWQSDSSYTYKSDWGALRLNNWLYDFLQQPVPSTSTPTPTLTPTATPTPTTGSVMGTAYDDANGNGQFDAGDTSLQGAVLALKRSGVEAYTATSGVDGSYRFSAVAPGTYILMEKTPPSGYQLSTFMLGLSVGANEVVGPWDFPHQRVSTATPTPTRTPTQTRTPMMTRTPTPTRTRTPTATARSTSTRTNTPSPSPTPSRTRTPTATATSATPPAIHHLYLPLVLRRWPPLPDAPVLEPITGPEAQPSYTVHWAPAPRAESYVLEWATDPGFSEATQLPTSNTSYQATSKGIAIYYYQVMARNRWGDSGWSAVQSVEVRWESEPNDTYIQASGPLASGKTYYGLPETLNDYFYFDMAGPGSLTVELSGHTAPSIQVSLWYESTALPDNRKQRCTGHGGCSLTYTGAAGQYYIQVYTESGFSQTTPYVLQAVFP